MLDSSRYKTWRPSCVTDYATHEVHWSPIQGTPSSTRSFQYLEDPSKSMPLFISLITQRLNQTCKISSFMICEDKTGSFESYVGSLQVSVFFILILISIIKQPAGQITQGDMKRLLMLLGGGCWTVPPLLQCLGDLWLPQHVHPPIPCCLEALMRTM